MMNACFKANIDSYKFVVSLLDLNVAKLQNRGLITLSELGWDKSQSKGFIVPSKSEFHSGRCCLMN